MNELRELYQETILDHTRRPRNFGKLEGATAAAHGHNPLCGDRVTVYVDVADGRLRDVRFEGQGCSISTASASLMTEATRGKTRAEIDALAERFHGMVTTPTDRPAADAGLGKLAALGGVREYPVRVKCATLVWHVLRAALEGRPDPITTE